MQTRIRFVLVLLFASFLCACGRKLDGTYTSNGNGVFEKLTFSSNGTVLITFMGMSKEARYEIAGNQVKIINEGETQLFTLDEQGCLNGSGMIGTYCKSSGPTESAKGSSGGGAISGTWEAKDPEGNVLGLQFLGGDKIKFSISDGSSNESLDGTCAIHGNQVVIQTPGGLPMSLTQEGNALKGTMAGMPVVFTRK